MADTAEAGQAKLPVREPVVLKPIEINGKFYDPFSRLQTTQGASGETIVVAGRELERDEAYSMMFWASGKPKGLREAMETNIRLAAPNGKFFSFASATEKAGGGYELDQESKERLSAYRKLAEQLGFGIGTYKFHKRAGTVEAEITNIGNKI
jgi:hypothetical protein